MRRRFRFLPSVVGPFHFCSLRHASNGFFRELATMSFASSLVRAMSAVCICCSTNSRFLHSSVLVRVCRQELEINCCRHDFRLLFSGPLQHHLRLLDHTSEECLRLLRPLLEILLSASEHLRTIEGGLSHR